MIESKETIAKVESPPYYIVDVCVRTNDAEEDIKKFEDLKAKYTANKIVITEWWEHPYFIRGNSHWLAYIDGVYYDVDYSSHEFEAKTEVDGKTKYNIEYTRVLHVHISNPKYVPEKIQKYKEERHAFYQNQAFRKKEASVAEIKKDYDSRIAKLEAERNAKIKEIEDLHYSLENDNSWQLANADIDRVLHGKVPIPPKKVTKSKK